MTSTEHLNLATILVVSHFLIAKVTPGLRLNSGFWNLNYCPFPLNKDVPSKEVTILKIIIMYILPGPNFVSPEWRCRKGEVPL